MSTSIGAPIATLSSAERLLTLAREAAATLACDAEWFVAAPNERVVRAVIAVTVAAVMLTPLGVMGAVLGAEAAVAATPAT